MLKPSAKIFSPILFSLFTLAIFCCASACLITPALAADSREGWPMHLRFLSGPNGGQWFHMGEPISVALTDSVLPTSSKIGGGVANIEKLNEKNGDIAFTLNCFIGASESGEEEYKSIKLDNTTILANVYPQVLYVLVRKDFAEKHNVKIVEELLALDVPVRFASLRPGTASEFILNLLLKYGYNTSFDRLKEKGWDLSFNNYAEIADNLVAGELDCFAYTAGTDVPLIHTIEDHTDVVILPLKQSVLDKLSEKFKTGTYVINPGMYKSATEPIRTLGDYTCLIVRKDFPDSLVYEIAKTLWNSKDAVANVISDFGALSPDTAAPVGLPVHPGALKFWNELAQAGGKR